MRLVRAEDTDVEVSHELALGGFDQDPGTWDGPICRLAGTKLNVAVAGGTSHVEGRWLTTTIRAPRGRWVALVVSLDPAFADADADRVLRRLAAMESASRSFLARAQPPRHHPERAAYALAVLEACTYRPTGSVVAAPTTSPPEAPGADRQFDYRHSWLRDASVGISVAALLGNRPAAERYLA